MEVTYTWPPWLSESYHPRLVPFIAAEQVRAAAASGFYYWLPCPALPVHTFPSYCDS